MDEAIAVVYEMIKENSVRIAQFIRERNSLDLHSYNEEYYDYLFDLETELIEENEILDRVINRLKGVKK